MADLPPEAEQAALLASAPLFRGKWYRERYPDVATSGLDPALHYLRHGALLGRLPSRAFDGAAYLADNPDVAAAGWNPLVHYLLHGKAEGRDAPVPPPLAAERTRAGRARLAILRDQMQGQGLEDAPLAALTALAASDPDPWLRARAGLDLAVWHLRQGDPAAALAAIADVRRLPPPAGRRWADREVLAPLAVLEQLALHRLGQGAAARAAFAAAARAGLAGPDLLLASVGALAGEPARLARINAVLARSGIAPLRLAPGTAPAYDRLTADVPPAPDGGPLVSVLLAAHEAEATIGTALRALTEQTWRNLEILVIDDASRDATCAIVARAAAADPRIRLIPLTQNGGAYVARNIGLAEARGDFVTLHDADDWAHPARIETQIRHLLAHPGTMANTSQQARAQDDLTFARTTGRGSVIITSTASVLFRRAPVREALGCWDGVRFGADNELIRRIRAVFGADTVDNLATGPLAFQRDRESSMLADPVRGMTGFYFGARKDYAEAQAHHHASGSTLNYGPGPAPRPFPVVPMMLPDPPPGPARLGTVIAGDLRDEDSPATRAALAALAPADAPLLGLVELYDPARAAPSRLAPALRTAVAAGRARVLVHGETVVCGRLVLPDPAPLAHVHRYLPGLRAAIIEGAGPWPPGRTEAP